eukprot:TRINITY_DN7948_c0_g2_i1.p1 TRINITY_DN7948_c0_g2~~TRINITY_DN7948_c0_g2_i1.p1  ORF type:complete len:549 (-),score=126.32 TRINITY_DN7948_c0_g2_i1:106-1752(-)
MAADAPPTTSQNWSTLYVGDLQADVAEPDLHAVFNSFGPIALIHVCRDSFSGRSLGYAYVNYYSHIDATSAMEKLNYKEIRGRCCRIMWSNPRRTVRGSDDANIFVKNLDITIDSKALYDTFSIFGNILSAKVSTDKAGNSRGYGFVQYESTDAAKQAIERVNGMQIGDRTVYVGPFKKREQTTTEESKDCSLYVKHIPTDWDDNKVTELFKPYGELESTLIVDGGKIERRYGFVNFKDPESAEKAIAALHGKDLRTDEQKQADAEKEKEKEADASADKAEGGEEKKQADAEKEKEKESDKLPMHCLFVGRSKTKSEREAETQKKKEELNSQKVEGIKLYVKNLPADTTDEKLKAIFVECGEVTDVKAVVDKEKGECKGYGFIRFATSEEANSAIEKMNDKQVFDDKPDLPPLHVSLHANNDRRDGKAGKGKGKGGKGDGKGGKGKGKGPISPMAAAYAGAVPGVLPAMYPGMPGIAGQRPPYPGMPPFAMPGMPPMAMMRPGMPGFGLPPRPGMPMGFAGFPGFPGAPVMPMPGMAPSSKSAPPRPP